MFSLEVYGEIYHEETRVMELSYSEDRVIVAWVVLTHNTSVARQKDRQTDISIVGSTALCIARYADAL